MLFRSNDLFAENKSASMLECFRVEFGETPEKGGRRSERRAVAETPLLQCLRQNHKLLPEATPGEPLVLAPDLLRRPPTAVVVFDQTNDFPAVRGRWNIHIDTRKPTAAQLERDGLVPRAAFLARWATTALRCALYALRVRPYTSATRYG